MVCKEPGCDGLALKHGWCRPHGNEVLNPEPSGICRITHCDRPAVDIQRQVCTRHRKQKLPKSPQPIRVCSINGCQWKHFGRGWCKFHYGRWLRWGELRLDQPAKATGKRKAKPRHRCSIPGCLRIHEARGWCELHYGRWLRHGDPLHLEPKHLPIPRPPSICSVVGCGVRVKGHGLCNAHLKRWRTYGDPLADVPVTGRLRFCSVEGCTRRYSSKGYCTCHRYRVRIYGDPCGRPEPMYGDCAVCGKEFEMHKVFHKYCSPLCKGRAQRGHRFSKQAA